MANVLWGSHVFLAAHATTLPLDQSICVGVVQMKKQVFVDLSLSYIFVCFGSKGHNI